MDQQIWQALGLEKELSLLSQKLEVANQKHQFFYAGPAVDRQPIHTVYGGAQLFKSNRIEKLGQSALDHFLEYAPTAEHLLDGLCLDPRKLPLVELAYQRTIEHLKRQGIEDFRIDFEDGFGIRSDEEEDFYCQQVAQELWQFVQNQKEAQAKTMVGIRIKGLSEESKERALRTLALFLDRFVKQQDNLSAPLLPYGFTITLSKVLHAQQVEALVEALRLLEQKLRLPQISIELMIEHHSVILDQTGKSPLRAIYEAARGRCRGLHFGTYDYSSSVQIVAQYQRMTHESCEFAKQLLLLQFSNTPVFLSDGVTNVMPVAIHKGNDLSADQRFENHLSVYDAWKLSFEHISHSLKTGFYQGWDVHPHQISIRYVSTYLFFLESLSSMQARMTAFLQRAAQASRLGDIFDDAASAQGILNYFMKAYDCGAITENDLQGGGLTKEKLSLRSFKKILEAQSYASPTKAL